MGTNEFGYVGASPTQSSSSNNGVFGSDDVYDLLSENKWALQTADFEYLQHCWSWWWSFWWLFKSVSGGSGGYLETLMLLKTSGQHSSTETTHSLDQPATQ